MPDPVLYSVAMIVTALVSALLVLTLGGRQASPDPRRQSLITFAAFAVGLPTGLWILGIRPAWPPMNALGRLLWIGLPAVVSIELMLAVSRGSSLLRLALRSFVAAALCRLLLHGSVYLSVDGASGSEGWTTVTACSILAAWGIGIGGLWGLLLGLNRLLPAGVVPLALALSLQALAFAVILSGYVSGGAAALPFVATLCGISLAHWRLRVSRTPDGLIGMSLVGLSGLIITGHYFGALTLGRSGLLLGAPALVMCGVWLRERCRLSDRLAILVGTLAVLIPLVVVVWLASDDFLRKTAPLLGESPACQNHTSDV